MRGVYQTRTSPRVWYTVRMDLNDCTDHDIFELLKEQDADAWAWVWEKVVLAEARSLRSSEMSRRWGVSPESLMSDLYSDMIGAGRIYLYRDDGGSLAGWLKRYVRGYVLAANPANRREVSLDAPLQDDGDDDGRDFSEKVAKELSERAGGASSPVADPEIARREEWETVQLCFRDLWKAHPLRACVHLLKLKSNLSSAEIRDMLGISSQANVDQLFSRAVKDMQEAKVRHGKNS